MLPKTELPLLSSLGSYSDSVRRRLAKMRRARAAERFWAEDPALWSSEPLAVQAIRERLGWLTSLQSMRADCVLLRSFADEVRHAGFTHALLLGMGGSSLCPEVCRQTFRAKRGYLDLAVLDSTDPGAVRCAERRAPVGKTLFIVATKSGTTTETLAFFRYFHEQVRKRKGARAGENFVAITDPGSPLVALADEKKFRRTFLNPPDIGGRYSALSYFGLVPAALMGVDIDALLDRAIELLPENSPDERNPAFVLGAALAELAGQGRDKVTFVLSRGISAFGCWAEQLVAESTGKEGNGLFPVDGEPLGLPKDYAADRVFVHMRLQGARDSAPDSTARQRLKALEKAGHPVIRIDLKDTLDLGREFFRWEIATAIAASEMGVNAFDEPNVQESKDNTARLLRRFVADSSLTAEPPLVRSGAISFFGNLAVAQGHSKDAAHRIQDLLAQYFQQTQPGGYLAILAYLAPSPAIDRLLQKLQLLLRDTLRIATSAGYGPRYLHSTGQFHKGGPANGSFLQITTKDKAGLPIPSLPYNFSLLKQAQSRGDQEALESRGRPFLRVHLEGPPETGLRQLLRWMGPALKASRRAR